METIIMKIILVALVILGIYIIYKKKNKYELIINNVFWILGAWVFALVLYFFSGIKYTFNLNIYSFGYIVLFLGIFLLGQYISKFIFKDKMTNNDEKTEKNDFSKKLNFLPLFIISLISVILYAIYIIAINDIKIGVTRDINTNGFATLLLIISNSSLVIWLYELAYSLLNEKRISWYGICSAVVYNLPGIIISGRDALMIFVISTVIVFLYCAIYAKKVLKTEGKMLKRVIKYAILAVCLMLIYLIFLTNNRYGTGEDAAIQMFRWSAGCEFPEYLENIYYNLGGLGKLIINIVFYYSSQISKLAFVFENYDGPYLGGLFQLHYVSRLLPDTWNLDYSLVSQKLAELTNNEGVPGLKVFWDTAIGYSIYDFGRIVTLFISFICGIVTGKVNSWCKKNVSILKIIMQVYICIAMFLTIQLSPLFDYYYIFPLFWMVLIILLNIKYEKLEKQGELEVEK